MGVLANHHIASNVFKCPRAADIWWCLKLDGFVEEAFAVDRVGLAALDYILCESARSSLIPGSSAQLLILVGI